LALLANLISWTLGVEVRAAGKEQKHGRKNGETATQVHGLIVPRVM
jgi:hypothetical protein